MQYFRPGGNLFVGDCMPNFFDGVFHLYYLLDEGHHQGHGGLGGHQWAHASTTDLVNWKHHALAIAITEDWEASICTGSVFHPPTGPHSGAYHAFYATRMNDRTEHLSHAESPDGVTFTKTLPNPFFSSPAGYTPDFRDPFVFQDQSGRFHMLVTTKIKNFSLFDRGGCLLHLSSENLSDWQQESPFLIPTGKPGYACIPECSDWFQWGSWYYLVFGLGLQTHYRISRQPFGPWERPEIDTLGNEMLAVMKTAPLGQDRRIGVGWIGTRANEQDNGVMQWGGNAVFRELVQNDDGSLGTKFPEELVPLARSVVEVPFEPLTSGAIRMNRAVQIEAPQSLEVGAMLNLPLNYRLRTTIQPGETGRRFGLGIRGYGNYFSQYNLDFIIPQRRVELGQESISYEQRLDQSFTLDMIVVDDIVDVCIDNYRCLINRLPELKGDRLFFVCENGTVTFDEIQIMSIA